MRALDAELVQEGANGVRKEPERVAAVDALARTPVDGQVGNDHAVALRERVDVAGVVRQPGRARPAGVQQHHRIALPRLGDEELPARGADRLRLQLRAFWSFRSNHGAEP